MAFIVRGTNFKDYLNDLDMVMAEREMVGMHADSVYELIINSDGINMLGSSVTSMDEEGNCINDLLLS